MSPGLGLYIKQSQVNAKDHGSVYLGKDQEENRVIAKRIPNI
jgi:hypothetical protein